MRVHSSSPKSFLDVIATSWERGHQPRRAITLAG